MTVELNARFVSELNESYPRQGDLLKEGDDHMRLIKSCLKQTFPSFNRTVNITAEKFNYFDGLFDFTSDTATLKGNLSVVAEKVLNFGDNQLKGVKNPTEAQDVVTKDFFDKNLGTIAWPVGSIYMTADGRNPAELMGFGVWEAYATGRVLVGSGSGKDDRGEARLFALGAAGGEYGHVLVESELASHNHSVSGTTGGGGDHSHTVGVTRGGDGGNGGDDHDYVVPWGSTGTSTGGNHSHSFSGTSSNTGGNGAHNNIQPFMVVNIWRRTA